MEEHDTLFGEEDLAEKGICFLALILRHRKTKGVCGRQALAKGRGFCRGLVETKQSWNRDRRCPISHGMRPVGTEESIKKLATFTFPDV